MIYLCVHGFLMSLELLTSILFKSKTIPPKEKSKTILKHQEWKCANQLIHSINMLNTILVNLTKETFKKGLQVLNKDLIHPLEWEKLFPVTAYKTV